MQLMYRFPRNVATSNRYFRWRSNCVGAPICNKNTNITVMMLNVPFPYWICGVCKFVTNLPPSRLCFRGCLSVSNFAQKLPHGFE